jgi:hypothetical protein
VKQGVESARECIINEFITILDVQFLHWWCTECAQQSAYVAINTEQML